MTQQCSKCHGPLEKVRVNGKPELWVCLKCQREQQRAKMKPYVKVDKTILKIN